MTVSPMPGSQTAVSPRDQETSAVHSIGGGATVAGSATQIQSTTAGFLSKITRSPSRKHQQNASSGSVDTALEPSTSAPNHRHTTSRPVYTRTTTAPAGPVTNVIKVDVGRNSTGTDPAATKMPTMLQTEVKKSVPTSRRSPESDIPYIPLSTGIMPAYMNQTGPGLTPNSMYQHVHKISKRRMATLDYIRKVHQGRTFWFNTTQFTPADIAKLPSYTQNRLSRRATNFLLLGMSIPAVLDVHPPPHPNNTPSTNAAIAQEYLRSLNNLLMEFEAFQQLHPPDGSGASTLSRARIPQMFRRAATTASRPRRTSAAPVSEIGAPIQSATSPPPDTHQHTPQLSIDTTTSASNSDPSIYSPPATALSASTATTLSSHIPTPQSFPTTSSFPPALSSDLPNSTLSPSETTSTYSYLLTPPLPFSPDFNSVFATLCDVLIETYQRILLLINNPAVCSGALNDLFGKCDARIRKILVNGIVREFEQAARDGVRKELGLGTGGGVQRVVLGGLMGG